MCVPSSWLMKASTTWSTVDWVAVLSCLQSVVAASICSLSLLVKMDVEHVLIDFPTPLILSRPSAQERSLVCS